jgi:hypothetical protein
MVFAASSRPCRASTRTCATPSRSCASTTAPSPSSPRPRGPRLRLPLRLPRPAPHGDHPGAPRARVQPRPHHHRAERRLPRLLTDGEMKRDREPGAPARPPKIDRIEEPIFKVDRSTCPSEYVGAVLKLCRSAAAAEVHPVRVGRPRDHHLRAAAREVLFDFHDKLKSVDARLRLDGLRARRLPRRDLVKLDILVNGDKVDALSSSSTATRPTPAAKILAKKLKEIVPRQQFEVAIQAAIGGKIIARETVKALRKDVTAKCYGGDISRKRKLLEKQKGQEAHEAWSAASRSRRRPSSPRPCPCGPRASPSCRRGR